MRTLSGAFATSLVTTSWENQATYMHAELAGLVDSNGDAVRAMANAGASMDAIRSTLDSLTWTQSVMLATNEIMLITAVVFCFAASLIWLAPRPTRAVDMSHAH